MTSRRRIQLPFVERADGTVTTQDDPHPAYVVWELTLRCDQPCTHCGSRAGDARESELDTEAALDVVRQLAAMRTREVAVIGGEAYLHPGFLAIVRALAHAGLARASVSIDGLEPTHDLMRAARGSFASATRALAHLRAARIQACQVQLTTPLGRGRGWPGHDPPAVRSARPRAADRGADTRVRRRHPAPAGEQPRATSVLASIWDEAPELAFTRDDPRTGL